MNSFASLALATEPPKEEFLDQSPFAITKEIFYPKMKKHILGQVIYQIILMIIIVFDGNIKILSHNIYIFSRRKFY